MDTMNMAAEGETDKIIEREPGEVNPARKAQVKDILENIAADRAHFKGVFAQMKKDIALARRGTDKSWAAADKYVANIIGRHVNQQVATLYAKNPRAVARRRKRREFKVWDGKLESLQAAMQALQIRDAATGLPVPNPEAILLLQDAAAGLTRRQMLDNLADTLALTYEHQISQQEPGFKKSMKKVVRRALTTGVGYVKLSFQRLYNRTPEMLAQAATHGARIAHIERLMADIADEEKGEHEKELAELKTALDALNSEMEVVDVEGLTFNYPASTAIIPHRRCYSLLGFAGADYVTEVHEMTADEIKEIFKKDIRCGDFTPHINGKAIAKDSTKAKDGVAIVYETYNKKNGTVYYTAEGYEDFLREPATPDVRLERFYPWFLLTFNETVEEEDAIFPVSDVERLRPMQLEYNRARQALREHRFANRPKTFARRGSLTDDDKSILVSAPANAVVELDGIAPNQSVNDVLQAYKPVPIDQAIYTVEHTFIDVQRVSGAQEANLGGTSGATATESSIAEGSRSVASASNVDELDELLSELARAGGQLLLSEMSAEEVEKIVGPGAVWPELSREEISSEVYLEIEMGSSGRPNRQAELQNFERLAPTLLQIPGVGPLSLAKEAIRRLDDRLDPLDFLAEGLPAITSINAMAQKMVLAAPGTGDPATDPNQQGGAGANNAPVPPGTEMSPPAPPTDLPNMQPAV